MDEITLNTQNKIKILIIIIFPTIILESLQVGNTTATTKNMNHETYLLFAKLVTVKDYNEILHHLTMRTTFIVLESGRLSRRLLILFGERLTNLMHTRISLITPSMAAVVYI